MFVISLFAKLLGFSEASAIAAIFRTLSVSFGYETRNDVKKVFNYTINLFKIYLKCGRYNILIRYSHKYTKNLKK